MQITFDEKKKLDTNPVFNLFVQGENMAESIRIVGPKMVGALDLSQLRMAVRMTNAAYETMVEQTLEQDVTDDDTITLVWNVDRQFTSKPGHAQVMLVGYGNNEEVIKITSSGIEIKEDETFVRPRRGALGTRSCLRCMSWRHKRAPVRRLLQPARPAPPPVSRWPFPKQRK